MRNLGRAALGLLLVGWLAMPSTAGDWRRFRGPGGQGVADETDVPQTWDPETHVKWRASLPGEGNGSPVVSAGRVFVTVANDEGRRRGLYCYDRRDGRLLWEQSIEFSGEEPTHKTNPYCGSSPAVDDQRVVVWHSSAGLHCYDLDGHLQWSRDLGPFVHIWGYGASPVIHRDTVILNCGPGERTFVIALDKHTGRTLWQVDEEGGASGLEKNNPQDKRAPRIGSWSTPVVARIDGQDQVIVSMPWRVKAYAPATGDILWQCEGLGDLVYTSVVLGNGVAVAMGGFHGPAIAFRPGGSGDITESRRVWRVEKRNPQRIGSGIIIDRHMYMANEPGIAQCLDVETGKELWTERMPGGKLWGSLVLAGGRFYVTNQQGETLVWRPNPEKLDIVAVNPLGETSNSTPAISDGQIFLRTHKALYCIDDE